MTRTLARDLRHVRWLGGGSGAGKTTVAARLAERHGLRVYHADDSIRDHVARSDPQRHPLIDAFLAMDMDERWVRRSPRTMFGTFWAFQGEAFELIVDDLLTMRGREPILVEGFRLLPRPVAPLLSRPDQGVWLVPTPAFRRRAFARRPVPSDFLSRTSDPAQALDNLLARDALFTSVVARDAAALGLRTIRVASGHRVDDTVEAVAAALGL